MQSEKFPRQIVLIFKLVRWICHYKQLSDSSYIFKLLTVDNGLYFLYFNLPQFFTLSMHSLTVCLLSLSSTTVLQSMKLGVDVNRHKEIIVKAISAILLLLLKHFKLNHVYQVYKRTSLKLFMRNLSSYLLYPNHTLHLTLTQTSCIIVILYKMWFEAFKNLLISEDIFLSSDNSKMQVFCRSLSTWHSIWCLPTVSRWSWSSSTRTSCPTSLLKTGEPSSQSLVISNSQNIFMAQNDLEHQDWTSFCIMGNDICHMSLAASQLWISLTASFMSFQSSPLRVWWEKYTSEWV